MSNCTSHKVWPRVRVLSADQINLDISWSNYFLSKKSKQWQKRDKKFPDFSLTWQKKIDFPRLSSKFPDFSLTLKKNRFSLTFPWPMGTLHTCLKIIQIMCTSRLPFVLWSIGSWNCGLFDCETKIWKQSYGFVDIFSYIL